MAPSRTAYLSSEAVDRFDRLETEVRIANRRLLELDDRDTGLTALESILLMSIFFAVLFLVMMAGKADKTEAAEAEE